MYPTVDCPKCGRRLLAAGALSIGKVAAPVYSCPECLTRATVGGEHIEVPLTFFLGAGGRPVDLAHPCEDIDLKPYDAS